ncbi:SDR family oxidoreductase [Pseudomonas aeruginosa]|uniref:SDR family oxidoreductase n=1 Tax=Pseudomonas aeruginosa TaxID=287 RepID=UPI000F87EE9E|nr:SDR family oxidoreductase [Pseudomonas aeruginosa]RUH83687.1 SDR family oxidoreductase [Pseudomonas aeruginosa]
MRKCKSIDILCINKNDPRSCFVEGLAPGKFALGFNCTVSSVCWILKYVTPRFCMQEKGPVINMASNLTVEGGDLLEIASYSAAQDAIKKITSLLVPDLALLNVRFSAITSGLLYMSKLECSSELLRDGRVIVGQRYSSTRGEDEVSCAALYLASNESEFLTGANIVIDLEGGCLIEAYPLMSGFLHTYHSFIVYMSFLNGSIATLPSNCEW